MVLVAILLVLTISSWFARNQLLNSIVKPAINSSINGSTEIRNLRWNGFCKISLERILLRAEGWQGQSAEVIDASNIQASVRFWPLLTGRVELEYVSIEQLTFRIAERISSTEDLNFMTLLDVKEEEEEKTPDTESSNQSIGFMKIDELVIESGEAIQDRFALKQEYLFNVRIEPLDSRKDLKFFELAQVRNTDTEMSPLLAKGWLNTTSKAFNLTLSELDLAADRNIPLPPSARAFCMELDMAGRIREGQLSWSVGEDFKAVLRVESLGLSMPDYDDYSSDWVRFKNGRIQDIPPPPLRMEANSGIIRLDGDVISLENFKGSLQPGDDAEAGEAPQISMDFKARLERNDTETTIDAISSLDQQGIDTLPFDLHFILEDTFNLNRDEENSVVDLPRNVANALENLQAVQWNLIADVHASRNWDPESSKSTDVLKTSARVLIDKGRGAYINFSYPLHDVTAEINASNDQVVIESLVAIGPDGNQLTVEGRLDGIGDDAGVDLHVDAKIITVNQDLINALPPETRKAVWKIFDQEAYRRLMESGVLNGLEPTRLFGMGSLNFKVNRDRGERLPLIVEGSLVLNEVGTVFDQFPYPMQAKSGTIIVNDESIILKNPGIYLKTPGGGEGILSGRIDIPRDGRGGRNLEPYIDLDITSDTINPALLAAIPPEGKNGKPVTAESTPGWPGDVTAGSILAIKEIGISGTIDWNAQIANNAEGKTKVHTHVDLLQGQIKMSPQTRPQSRLGKMWPQNLILTQCTAVLTTGPDLTTLSNFQGSRGKGKIFAQGEYTSDNDELNSHIDFSALDIELWMTELFSDSTQQQANDIFVELNPEGILNGTLKWQEKKSEENLLLKIEPNDVVFSVEEKKQWLIPTSGTMILENGILTLENIAIRTDQDESLMLLVGGIAFTETADDVDLDVSFVNMRFNTPLVEQTLRMSAGDGFADLWEERQPQGIFQGSLNVETSPGDSVVLQLDPESFSMLSNAEEPNSRGGGLVSSNKGISYHNDILQVGPLTIDGTDGTILEIDALARNLKTDPIVEADWSLECPRSSVPETQFLPPPLAFIVGPQGISSGALNADGHVTMEFKKGSERPLTFESTAHTNFVEGTINLGGVVFTDIVNETNISILVRNEIVESLEGTSFIPSAMIEGRKLDNVRLHTVNLPEEEELTIMMTMTEGNLYGGPVRGTFRYVPDAGDYLVGISMVDVGLAGIANGELDPDGESGGQLMANLNFSGTAGAEQFRIGRGNIFIEDADIAGNRGSMALLRLGQLMLPGYGGLEEAEIELLINGNEAILSDILLNSPSLTMRGEGRLRLSDFSLTARLYPKGNLGTFSDVLSAVTGTVYAIDVEGTPGEPEMSLTPLPIMVSPPEFNSLNDNPPPETPTGNE